MADGFLQYHPGAFGQLDCRKVLADPAEHRGRRGEIGHQRQLVRDCVAQVRIGTRIEEIHGDEAEPCVEATPYCIVPFVRRHCLAQTLFYHRQRIALAIVVAGQGKNAGVGMQQTFTVELVQRRDQLAQGEIAQGAKESKDARQDSDIRHCCYQPNIERYQAINSAIKTNM
ncbi:hypothetical protein FQZ97_1092120 [compost metagenome]